MLDRIPIIRERISLDLFWRLSLHVNESLILYILKPSLEGHLLLVVFGTLKKFLSLPSQILTLKLSILWASLLFVPNPSFSVLYPIIDLIRVQGLCPLLPSTSQACSLSKTFSESVAAHLSVEAPVND